MHVSSTDGVTLELHDLGGEGRPLLLCHATGFLGLAYEPMASWLREHHQVWAIDFRAHGDSTVPVATGDDGPRFDWSGVADDALAAIAAITDEPIDGFGHSMGGAALMLAERRRPGTLRSAYLYEPIVMPADYDEADTLGNANPMATSARRRRSVFPSKAEALLRYAGRPPLSALNAGALANYVVHGFADRPDGTTQLKLDPEHEARYFEGDGKPTFATVAEVKTPTTVAVGGAELTWSPGAFGPGIVASMPDARLVTFEHLGHFGPLQDPIGVTTDLVRWLGEVEAST